MIKDITNYFQQRRAKKKWIRDALGDCKRLLANLDGTIPSLVSEGYLAETLATGMCILMTFDEGQKGMPREFYDKAVGVIRVVDERLNGDARSLSPTTVSRLEERANGYYGRTA